MCIYISFLCLYIYINIYIYVRACVRACVRVCGRACVRACMLGVDACASADILGRLNIYRPCFQSGRVGKDVVAVVVLWKQTTSSLCESWAYIVKM